MKTHYCSFPILSGLVALALIQANASAHEDINIAYDGSNKLIAGSDGSEKRYYLNGLNEFVFTNPDYIFLTSDNPGFQNSSTLPAGTNPVAGGETAIYLQPVAIRLPNGEEGNLFYWDGKESVNFLSAAGGPTVMEVTEAIGNDSFFLDGSPNNGPLLLVDLIDNDGNYHSHVTFDALSAGNTSHSDDVPRKGFYLTANRLVIDGYTSSDPLLFMFHGPDEPPFGAFGDANNWARDNVDQVSLVPEPAAAMLLLVAAPWICSRSTRNRR